MPVELPFQPAKGDTVSEHLLQFCAQLTIDSTHRLPFPLYQSGETLTISQLLGDDFMDKVTSFRYLGMGKPVIDQIALFSRQNYTNLTQDG
jgi:hypothetical protein